MANTLQWKSAVLRAGVVLALLAVLLPLASRPASGADFCGFVSFVNGLDEEIKVREIVDGKENRLKRLNPGQGWQTQVEDDMALLVRRTSDREVLWRQSDGCDDAGTTVRFGDAVPPEIQCTFRQAVDGGPFAVDVTLEWDQPGARIALNLERGDRQGDNYIYLGRYNPDADGVVNYEGQVDGRTGQWTVMARVVLPDTKGDRFACGQVTLDATPPANFPDGIDGQNAAIEQNTTCWVFVRGFNGETVSDVVVRNPGRAKSLNYRGDDGWVATERADAGGFAPTAPIVSAVLPGSVTKVIIRGGDNAGTVSCEPLWPNFFDDGFESSIIEVDSIAERTDGSAVVLFTLRLEEFPNGGGLWALDTRDDRLTRLSPAPSQPQGIAVSLDCNERYLVFQESGFIWRLLDTQTGELAFIERTDDEPNADVRQGFDCNGSYWWEFDGTLVRIELSTLERVVLN